MTVESDAVGKADLRRALTLERPPRDRKAEHLDLASDVRMQSKGRAFDRWRFDHVALPEIALEEVDTTVPFLGKTIGAPLLVSCMTGGTAEAAEINRNLAVAAEEWRLPLGVGSQRAALEDPGRSHGFEVRLHAPSIPVLANLGAVQLNYGFGIDECRAAVEMVEADALVFHLNPLQEALQPEGQTDFRELARKMGEVAAALEVPVAAKEVGAGISAPTARLLLEHGVSIVDTAGLGGTSWARIESVRAGEPELGTTFADWGIPTPDAIRALSEVEGLTVIGSGGVRSGVDVAKAVALGASIAGMAYPFLLAARESAERVAELMEIRMRELEIAMFCLGVRTVEELGTVPLHRQGR